MKAGDFRQKLAEDMVELKVNQANILKKLEDHDDEFKEIKNEVGHIKNGNGSPNTRRGLVQIRRELDEIQSHQKYQDEQIEVNQEDIEKNRNWYKKPAAKIAAWLLAGTSLLGSSVGIDHALDETRNLYCRGEAVFHHMTGEACDMGDE